MASKLQQQSEISRETDFTVCSKLQAFDDFDGSISFGDSNNELLQVIKKLEAMMVSIGHALYKCDIYVNSPSAKFTYVLMMSAESYINGE